MPTKPHAIISITLITLVLAAHSHIYADTAEIIIGKVVSVADGDTITVLENKTQYRIRLFGIDAPERRQDFSNRAKQFVADLVFGKQVQVVKQDVDRYGRIVGTVYIGNVCVNEELVRNGLAWVYRYYCKIPVCEDWLELESQARAGKVGLWSVPDPVPPWEFRRPRRTPTINDDVVYHGNQNSRVFHHPSCVHYNCKNCVIRFSSRQEAKHAGFRACGNCMP